MQPPLAVFCPQTSVTEAAEQIRQLASKAIITYGFVTDEEEKLLGIIVMRDLLLAQSNQRLEQIMLTNPLLSHAGHVSSRSDESRAGSALPGLSRL